MLLITGDTVVWPLVYVEAMLLNAKLFELARLIDYAQCATTLPLENWGRDWEYIVHCAIGLVLYSARLRSLTYQERLIVGPLPVLSRPSLVLYILPETIESFDDEAKRTIQDAAAKNIKVYRYSCSYPSSIIKYC